MVSKKAEKFLENENHTKFITFSIRIIVKALTIQTQDTTVHCTDLRKSIYVFQRLNSRRITHFFKLPFCSWAYSSAYKHLCAVILTTATGTMYFIFCRLYPSSPQPPRHCSVWLLPVISLLLTSTVSITSAGLPINMIGEVLWGPKRRRASASVL